MTLLSRAPTWFLITLGLALAGCQGKDDLPFAPATDGSSGDDSGITGDDTAVDDSATDDSAIDDSATDDSGGGSGMDEEGDVAAIGVNEDELDLSDASGDSNLEQDFFLIAVNSSNTDGGYRLRYTPASTSGSEGPPAPAASTADQAVSPIDQRNRSLQAERQPVQQLVAPPTVYDQSDIGTARQTYNVLSQYEGEETSPVRTRLWAIGDYVYMWVDEEVPIDWDYDCDGTIDQPADYNAYGFNNCDLQTVADIVDNNIIVNIRALYGEESDINGDGKVSVVISPVLNTVPLSSSDEDDWPQVVSYADPVTDLNDFNDEQNPGSDEQEVMYVFAPDPYGFYNPFFPTTVAEYTSMGLAAEIARSYLKLVLYNTHVLSYEAEEDPEVLPPESAGQPEATWLAEVLGAIAADYCGFGAPYYGDSWRYLDASYLFSLTAFDQESLFAANSRGAQYLFGLWLVERFGTELLTNLAQTEYTGVDNIEDATGEDIVDLIREWQIAMLVTDVSNSDGEALVTSDDGYTLYAQAESLSAPTTAPETPSAGVFYGANGHQRGFNVRGPNRWIEGGTTSNPVENTTRRVVANGPDFHTYVPGFNFYGYTSGGYGSHFVRMTRIEYDAAAVELQSSIATEGGDDEDPEGIFGALIRWVDSPDLDNAVDDIYSPLDVNATALPDLPSDGSEIYAFGEISSLVNTQVVTAEGDISTGGVEDTDRYLLDLTDRTSNELVQVAIWLDRRFATTAGQVGPEDPWVAIVPEDDLPSPTVNDFTSDTCPTSESTWAYPNSVLEHLFTQVFLSSTLYDDGDFELVDGDGAEVCGTWTGGLACEDDWDRDGVANADEPQPTTFVQQVLVEQCQDNSGALPAETIDDSWVDADSVDEDDLPSYSVVYNVGGRSGEDGEEALLVTTVYGGERYVVVVGGNGDVGAYELSLKQLN